MAIALAVAAGALVLIALLVAPAADGRTLRAQGVLPPGQSGFVSTTGLPTGTGSPHLTDQVGLFTSFEYKPLTFNEPGASESPRAGVTIVRDAYGVPEVTGDSEYNAWWGIGYAVAQDRLFELELFRRATSGRLAEILGSAYLDDDYIARRDYYTNAEVDAMLARVPQRLIDRAEAYRDGINAWIDDLNPVTEMPGEFVALLDLPIPDWTLRETARVGVFLARTVPSGDGEELANAIALRGIGRRNFKLLHPIRTPGRRTTVPRSQGLFKAQPGRTRRDERRGFRKSRRYLRGIDLEAVTNTTEELPLSAAADPGAGLRGILPSPGGSFMWAIRDPARQRAYQFNGPQLGFSIPELFVEWELHSPELPHIRGVSAPGVPLMGIGHNGHIAWGFTSGLSDEDDLFAVKLTGPESYRFRGVEREMDCRDETFTWNTPPTSLPDALEELIGGGGAPAGSTTERICRTLHGPVQFRGDGVAFARRYAIWGRELETFKGIDRLNRARSVRDVHRALLKVTWNENVIAADDRGHIGYWHPGLHPLRPRRWDERLPFPGNGRAEWRGLLPRRRTPHVIDPPQGWLANWNNPPSWGWTNADGGSARERMTGPFHRVRLLQRLARRVAQNPSYGDSTAIIRTSGTTAQQRPFVNERRLRRARRVADSAGRRTLRALLAWDGDYHTTNGGGTVDPGVAIWEEFKDRLEALLIGPMGPEAEIPADGTGSSHAFDISNGEAVALRVLGRRRYARAAEATAAALTTRFGTGDVDAWREPRRMYEVAAQGAGASPALPFFDRGTWEQSVAVGG